jgi:hypothetical protein
LLTFLHVARWLSAANAGKRKGNEVLVETRSAWVQAYKGDAGGENQQLKEWFAELAAGAYKGDTPALLTEVRCTGQGAEDVEST